MLNDEFMILKNGNFIFGEEPDFMAKEVNYHNECKRNYLHEVDKSSNIKNSALERFLCYIRNKIIPENKLDLASSLLDIYKIIILLKVQMKTTWLPIMLRIYVVCYDNTRG